MNAYKHSVCRIYSSTKFTVYTCICNLCIRVCMCNICIYTRLQTQRAHHGMRSKSLYIHVYANHIHVYTNTACAPNTLVQNSLYKHVYVTSTELLGLFCRIYSLLQGSCAKELYKHVYVTSTELHVCGVYACVTHVYKYAYKYSARTMYSSRESLYMHV